MLKTLQQFMREQHDSEQVFFIGAETAFIFIGTKADYKKYFEEDSKEFLNAMLNHLETWQSALQFRVKRLVEIPAFDVEGTKEQTEKVAEASSLLTK